MNIERVPIVQLKAAAYNPRKDLQPDDPVYQKLRRSITEFGYVEPLVWNRRTGNLVGGHQRLKVLQEQGLGEVEVSVVDLSPEKEKALNIALNQITGEWDEQKLAALLDELVKVPDFDATISGFDFPDIQDLLANVSTPGSPKEEDFDVAAELEEEGPAVTQAGELIQLGEHRLLSGDSSKLSSYKALLTGSTAALLFTDPPYNVDYTSPSGISRSGRSSEGASAKPKTPRWRPIANDRIEGKKYDRWLTQVLKLSCESLSPGAALYIWNGHKNFGLMHRRLRSLDVKVSAVITWAKPSFTLGRGDYKQQTEFCLYGWREGGGSHHWYGPLNESTLWQIQREPTKQYQHPTQKPLELAERAIRNSSRARDLVLDPFLGSGTTLIAAERTGRRCFGIELDPLYCDVIVRRYIAFVGEANANPDLVRRYARREEVKAA